MTDQPSPLLVEQRIRNRIIEYLELVSSFQAQRSYDHAGSLADVPNEVINQWQDWVHCDPRQHDDHSLVYTANEIDALRSFHAAWESVTARLPQILPPLTECQSLTAWQDLRSAAVAAAQIFAYRGNLPEDRVDP
ncbi:MAG: hypothetical protein IPG97_05525 [Microthrixaceae bacterium]|jgi:thioesterase domain-containing protein|nr:hypothetical protein [Microthrixaceae bacterium]